MNFCILQNIFLSKLVQVNQQIIIKMACPLIKSLHTLPRTPLVIQLKKLSLFGINSLLRKPKLKDPYTISRIPKESYEQFVGLMKKYYLQEHVFVQSRNMEVDNDTAFDEYLLRLLKQDNTLYAFDQEGYIAGFCVNVATSPDDLQDLRKYAYYRQNPNTRDFLYFTAKLQETPNFWTMFNQKKIFEIKMLAVLPEYRRQGIASMLVEKAQQLANKRNCKVVRFDCVNPNDHKVAEHCMMNCVAKYPLHTLRGVHAPFIKKSESDDRRVRIYAAGDITDVDTYKCKAVDLE